VQPSKIAELFSITIVPLNLKSRIKTEQLQIFNSNNLKSISERKQSSQSKLIVILLIWFGRRVESIKKIGVENKFEYSVIFSREVEIIFNGEIV
jgi:hypothetical protein